MGKYGPEKTPYLDTFYKVCVLFLKKKLTLEVDVTCFVSVVIHYKFHALQYFFVNSPYSLSIYLFLAFFEVSYNINLVAFCFLKTSAFLKFD